MRKSDLTESLISEYQANYLVREGGDGHGEGYWRRSRRRGGKEESVGRGEAVEGESCRAAEGAALIRILPTHLYRLPAAHEQLSKRRRDGLGPSVLVLASGSQRRWRGKGAVVMESVNCSSPSLNPAVLAFPARTRRESFERAACPAVPCVAVGERGVDEESSVVRATLSCFQPAITSRSEKTR